MTKTIFVVTATLQGFGAALTEPKPTCAYEVERDAREYVDRMNLAEERRVRVVYKDRWQYQKVTLHGPVPPAFPVGGEGTS